eukprot:GHRR01001761.1.p1 GENE.GHRR01001761.1~~GHRR01001761.1.p1  ORF type:complete len:323 (+),score=92.21 GHRR01001761.1:307-1275(+)
MRLSCSALGLVVVLALFRVHSYESEYAYDGYYDDEGFYDYLDDYGYYEDDGDQYYDEYGYYADNDFFGYDDYYDQYYDYDGFDSIKDCTVGKDGKVQLANGTASCDIKVGGVDKQADLLTGGMDGLYKLTGCKDGRPYYKRQNSTKGEDRILWYSKSFGDWDVSRGPEPTDKDILMYGGDIEHHPVPLFVKTWHLGGDLKSGSTKDDDVYIPVAATVKCADGKVYKPPPVNPAVQKQGPVLTDEEIESKYKLIYEKYGRRPDPNPTVNFSFVVMLVMIGLSIVLAIPYFLIRRRPGKSYQPVATSFAQVVQQSKKKQSGHIN